MNKHLITEDMVVNGRKQTRFTNLGPGFHLAIGGATELTIHRTRYHRGGHANIEWVNTYGNVHANNGLYEFTPDGLTAANRVLAKIVRER